MGLKTCVSTQNNHPSISSHLLKVQYICFPQENKHVPDELG